MVDPRSRSRPAMEPIGTDCASMRSFLLTVSRCFMVIVIIACLFTVGLSHGAIENQPGVPLMRHKRTVRGQQASDSSQSQGTTSSSGSISSSGSQLSLDGYNNINFNDYTPTTPSPDQVNCHVEVPETRRVGGVCVNLGHATGCQAGVYLAFSQECQNMNTRPTRTTRARNRSWTPSTRQRRRQTRLRRRLGQYLQRRVTTHSNSNP